MCYEALSRSEEAVDSAINILCADLGCLLAASYHKYMRVPSILTCIIEGIEKLIRSFGLYPISQATIKPKGDILLLSLQPVLL
jgi:hypothetical protein